jgi:hypothetical protein
MSRALNNYRVNRDFAEWNLELHSTGKSVGGKHVRPFATSCEIDELLSEVKFYSDLIVLFERKLTEVAL